MRVFGRGAGGTENNTTLVRAEIGNLIRDKEGIIDISIIDSDGRTLFSYKNLAASPLNLDDYKKTEGVLFREVTLEGKRCLELLIPQQTMGLSSFYFKYIMYFPAIEKQMTNINYLLAILGLISVTVAFLLSYYYTKKITIPLRILEEKARAIKAGDMEQEIPELEDEIGALADALKTMLSELKKKQQELMLQNERLNEALNEVLFLQNQMLNYEKFAALGKISAGMSHEIDNPLGIIIGHAEYLKSELPEDSQYREDLDTIIKEATRIKGIMRSLLSFAKPKESKIKEIELKGFTKRVLDNFSFQRIFRNIKLTFEGEEVFVNADEEKLHQVLVNVVLNAIQAMPKGGEISVKIFQCDGFGTVTVTDTGCGIPEELQSRVFDLFFSTKSDGTGLGLAVTKSFIEEMGGRIALTSREGQGTTVSLFLPLIRR